MNVYLQGQLRYVTDGLYPAPLFFDIGFETGTITLTRSVLEDAIQGTQYLLKLLVFDTAYPNDFGTATATIFVNRNPSTPVFLDPTCQATISESTTIGSLILNQTAIDGDGVSYISYLLTSCC